MALQVLEQQPRIAGNPYVFSGRGKAAFNSFSQRKDELDAKLPDIEPWVFHDLRRTARSLLSRAGVLPHIAERVLGHRVLQHIPPKSRHSVEQLERPLSARSRQAALSRRRGLIHHA
jgi:integrase